METILEYKWSILVSLEVLAWASTFFMFYARYGMMSTFWFKIGVCLTVITGVIPQVTMGVINFIGTHKIDLYTLIIIILIIYGATIGKRDVKKMDQWAQRKFGSLKQKQ